jgi:hypothetical protein
MTENEGLLAGIARKEITPPAGRMMGGYGDRVEPAQGAHDPLWGQVLILNDGAETLCLIVLDLLTVDQAFTESFRKAVGETTNIPPEHVQLICTHTHGAPLGFRPLAPEDATDPVRDEIAHMRKDVHQILLEAVQEAQRDLQPVRLRVGVVQRTGICTNRLRPEGPMDDAISALALQTLEAESSPLAVLVNFTCHPTVLSHRNLLFTSDYPHYVRQSLQAQYGSDLAVFFTNGACGDVSTRFTRQEKTFEEAERIGSLVGTAAYQALQNAQEVETPSLQVRQFTVDMPVKDLPSLEEAQQEYEKTREAVEALDRETAGEGDIRLVETEFHGARANLKLVKYGFLQNNTAEVDLITLGDVALVAIPGEMFVSLGLAIKRQSPFTRTIILGYANDAIGYIPSREAYQEKGYEARRTLFAAGAGEYLVDQIEQQLRNIKESKS